MNFAKPFAPHRLKIYVAGTIIETIFLLIPTIGVEFGWLQPTFMLDLVANIILTLPFVFLPAIVLWDAPGENRNAMEKGAELILVWLPFTAFSQLTYELPYLIGNVLGTWQPTDDPGWQWIWWQYALADTRWWGTNPYMFALELVSVASGATILVLWLKLLNPQTTDSERLRALWFAFGHLMIISADTLVYFISEIRVGFADIGQGWIYGVGFKFLFMNLAFMVYPPFAIYFIYRQIDLITRSEARAETIRELTGIGSGCMTPALIEPARGSIEQEINPSAEYS